MAARFCRAPVPRDERVRSAGGDTAALLVAMREIAMRVRVVFLGGARVQRDGGVSVGGDVFTIAVRHRELEQRIGVVLLGGRPQPM